MNPGSRLRSAGRGTGSWLALLFVALAVIAPAACVLWYMDQTAKAQAEAAKQSIVTAYRGQLTLMRDRLDEYWDRRAVALDDLVAGVNPQINFANAVKSGLADSFIFRSSGRVPPYPALPAIGGVDLTALALRPNPDAESTALARQRAIAQMLHEPPDGKQRAIEAIAKEFDGSTATMGLDERGRLIAADEQLLALHLVSPDDKRRGMFLRRLSGMLNDYRIVMPAAQRLFLLREARAIEPGGEYPFFDAERIAIEFLESGEQPFSAGGLSVTNAPGLSKLMSRNGRVLALYRKESVAREMKRAIDSGNVLKGVSIAMVAPGERPPAESIAAGSMLPGWQVALSWNSKLPEDAARTKRNSGLLLGYLVIAAMVITGLLASHLLKRQLRLARLKTDLVSAVSHELKTPLASIRLLVDSLMDSPEPQSPGKTRDYLNLIAGENQRLIRLVENVLIFAKVERARHALELHAVAPRDLVREATTIVRERFAGCDFETHVEPDLPAIDADPDAMVSALLNLLDNAYKYTPAPKRIRMRAYSEPERIVFEVEDNGIGIAAREQRKIFRRFYRVDRRLARETGGCGLGLTIVESIVRAHGGSVEVQSKPGAGSTFRIRLPQMRAAHAGSITEERTITA